MSLSVLKVVSLNKPSHQGVPQALIKSLKIETMVYKQNLAPFDTLEGYEVKCTIGGCRITIL